MADNIPFLCDKPTRMLYANVHEKSAPPGTNAEPKFSGTFGLEQHDFERILPLQVQAITGACGAFSGNPADYYLACMSGKMAAFRVRETAKLKAQAARIKDGEDAAQKILEKAEKRAHAYEGYAGILSANSKFDVELARLEGGKVVDIKEPHAIALAGKDMFYSGAIVVPKISLKGFQRKTLDAKDGVTAFLQNVLYIAKGAKLDLGGGGPSNQDIYGGFSGYSDYDPTAMAPGGATSSSDTFGSFSGGVTASGGDPAPPEPEKPLADPNRPSNPKHRHDRGDGTEQWWTGSAWDGGRHAIPSDAPPAPVANPTPPTGAAPAAAMQW